MFGVALALGLSGIAGSVCVEMIASFLIGVTAGWVFSPTVKFIGLQFPHDQVSVAIGYYSLAWPLSMVLTGFLLPTLASMLGWRWPYYMLACLSFLIGILFLFVKEKGKSQEKLDLSVIREKNVILLASGEFLFFLGFWTLALYGYLYLVSVGLTRVEAGLVYSMLAVAGLLSSPISGYVMNRFGTRNSLSGSAIMYAASLLVFSFARSFLVLLFLAAIIGFFRFIVTPSVVAAASIIGSSKKTGSVTGITNFFAQASGAVSPPIAAVIIQKIDYGTLWFAAAGLAVVASAVFYRMRV